MLLQFKFKNYKCFYKETILDLTATQEKNLISTILDVNGNKVLPIIEIHGANASGKSTVLDALHYMFNMIEMSNRIDVNKELLVTPFAFSDKSKNENSEFEISVVLGEYEYRYGFSLNKNGIDEEWLYKKKYFVNTRATQKIMFERCKNKISFGNTYKKYKNIWNLFKNNTDFNTSKLLILSIIAIKEENGIFRDLYNYIVKANFNAESIFNQQKSIDILNQNSSIYSQFEKIVNKFDPCLLGINIDEQQDNFGNTFYNVSGVHKSVNKNQNNILIPLQNESHGTIKMFNIMPTILLNLKNGGLLCIDELDIKFHPLLFKKIVNMYKDRETNKNNAQLIYTAHSTFLFDSSDLRRDEIYLIEKDSLGKSILFSLAEFQNLRIDADYEKKYLTGQFGAIPYEKD